MNVRETVEKMAREARTAARNTAALPTGVKNDILTTTARMLVEQRDYIQTENARDLEAGREKGLSPAMLDRLELSDGVIDAMVRGLEEIAALPDPVGEVDDMVRRPSGILVGRMRIPLGVVAMIYESRPNVTIDAAALCLKAGNAVFLRGGSEAVHSNVALGRILREAMTASGADAAAVQVVPTTDREAVNVLLEQEDCIDLVIPRGGESLIRFVAANSRIPVLKHYKGVCHAFVDRGADHEMAARIILNGKAQRPGVCNALETMLVHEAEAETFLPFVAARLKDAGVEIRGCEKTCALVPEARAAVPDDWPAEFLALILAVRVVGDLDAAMDHIDRYGSRHTEVIITPDYANSQRFLREVDAAAVMVNASSRFSDGGQFGLGSEIGISTSKLHAYGPMGLRELTARKFIVYGEGEIRE